MLGEHGPMHCIILLLEITRHYSKVLESVINPRMDVFSDRCKALPENLSFVNVWLQIRHKMLQSKA